MKKRFILLLFLLITSVVSAQESPKEYLQKVIGNLEKIESASYTSFHESWQPGDTVPVFTHSYYVNEYDNPNDSTIGASYANFEAKDTSKMTYCYDGQKCRTTSMSRPLPPQSSTSYPSTISMYPITIPKDILSVHTNMAIRKPFPNPNL